MDSLQAETVRQAHASRDETAEAVKLLRQQQRKLREEASRLGRLKHALPRLRRIDDLEAERAHLGKLPEVAADFPARCRAALEASGAIALDVQRLDQEIAEAKAKLEALAVDDALLAQADAVDRLADQRATVVKATEDLPKRQVELERVRAELDELARRLGLADHAALLAAARPMPRSPAPAASLPSAAGCATSARNAATPSAASLPSSTSLARRREALGHVADPAPLRRQLDALPACPSALPDATSWREASWRARPTSNDRLQRLIVPVASADDLARLAVPDRRPSSRRSSASMVWRSSAASLNPSANG
jgi:hypothetical protein